MKFTVPAIIHQIWLGSAPPPIKLMKHWPNLHPTFKYIVWTDEKVKTIKLHNQVIFDWLRSPTIKADILRYEILYQMGGLYVDADFLCLKPVDHLFQYPFFASQDNYWWMKKGYLANGLMGCAPHHPLSEQLVKNIEGIQFKSKTGHGALTTGPKYLTETMRQGEYSVEILDKKLYMLEIDTSNLKDAFTVHINTSHRPNEEFMMNYD